MVDPKGEKMNKVICGDALEQLKELPSKSGVIPFIINIYNYRKPKGIIKSSLMR